VEGYILLCLSLQVLQTISRKNTTKEWDELTKVFGVVGPSQNFMDFCKAITYKVYAHDPAPDILEISKTSSCLTNAQVVILPIIMTMTLLSALLLEYEHVAQRYLQVTALADFKFSKIQEEILAEHAQKQNNGFKLVLPWLGP